jgi:hypothetical protein
MHLDSEISNVFQMLNDKKGEKAKYSQDKYVILTV